MTASTHNPGASGAPAAQAPAPPGVPRAVKGRTPVRIALALVVTLALAVGIWGVLATARSVGDFETIWRLESGVDKSRIALAEEVRATRRDVSSSADLVAAARAFAAGLNAMRDAGTLDDAAVAASVDRRHDALLRSAFSVVALRRAGDAAAAERLRNEVVLPGSRAIDASLERVSVDVAARDEADGPASFVELGAAAVLLVFGATACVSILFGLVGYRWHLERRRREEVARLAEAALSDSLTGLGNHRAFYDRLAREIDHRARTGSAFSLVMLDLDNLKEVNDTFGHHAGDERIRAVADCLRATAPEGSAYRTGGDEFMVVLPGERAWGALAYAQRLQAAVAAQPKMLSVSCGVVESASGLESADTLVRHADVALYEAKHTGRRVVVYSEGLRPDPRQRAEEAVARRRQRLLATALAQAVDGKDGDDRNHSETVSTLCVLIAQNLGLPSERVERLRLAGLLHDVGRLGLADGLLLKSGRLDPNEWEAMTNHVHMGHSIVAAAGLPEEALWILHHHERLDGGGYPDGLAGDEIPLESQVIFVAEAFEAMTADRPYRPALGVEKALAELDRGAGTQFDPACIEALRLALDSGDAALVQRLATDVTDETDALTPAAPAAPAAPA